MTDLRPSYLAVDAAARRLGLCANQMMAQNLVILLPDGRGGRQVPEWCTDPAIATMMPLLSDHFQGEALEFCLVHMRPKGDGQSGIDLLRAGEWRLVRDTLRTYRRRFDQILQSRDTAEWLSGYASGAASAAPSNV